MRSPRLAGDDLIDRRYRDKSTALEFIDLFSELLQFKVRDIADQCLVLAGHGSGGVHHGAGLVHIVADPVDDRIRLFRNDRDLLDRLEAVGKVVDHRGGDDIYQQAQQRTVSVDQQERRRIDARIKCD